MLVALFWGRQQSNLHFGFIIEVLIVWERSKKCSQHQLAPANFCDETSLWQKRGLKYNRLPTTQTICGCVCSSFPPSPRIYEPPIVAYWNGHYCCYRSMLSMGWIPEFSSSLNPFLDDGSSTYAILLLAKSLSNPIGILWRNAAVLCMLLQWAHKSELHNTTSI